ncbi:MAG: PaaI family thioesterase [Anaerolineales bacterium]|nr:PaaI family thioesterase [Anaerolineales bacterium]
MKQPDFFKRAMEEQFGEESSDLLLPPPVFSTLPCEFTAFDRAAGMLTARFPVREGYLNPFRTVQGGILAGFADNTIGPLSMMVALPNVTRRFEMKYSKPVTMDMAWVEVRAQLVSCEGRVLNFTAEIRDPDGKLVARAKAAHWLL